MKKFICLLLILTMLPLAVFSAPTELGEYVINTTALNVRAEPKAGSAQLGILHLGDKVEVFEITNGYWGRIVYNGQTAYISLNYAVHSASKIYTISDDGLALLKKLEGFAPQKYWDYTQWSIGYGTRCEEDEYPDGITEEEASELLIKAVSVYEAYLDAFILNNGVEISQLQYDALVSFTYNLGNVWVRSEDFTLRTILLTDCVGYTEQQIRDAFGEFVSAGGAVSSGLVVRRSKEADLFIKGTSSFPVGGFTDVMSSAWYADEVAYCLDKGYMKGMSETVFSPNTNVTREQFVLILANMAGVDTDIYKDIDCGMQDVPTGAWFSGAVTWAVQSGYVSGMAEGIFGRGQAIQRAALARLLYLYAEQNGMDVSSRAELDRFADYEIFANKSNSWMVAPISWAVEKGIISGVTRDGMTYLDPKATATRAQTARMLMQFCEL